MIPNWVKKKINVPFLANCKILLETRGSQLFDTFGYL